MRAFAWLFVVAWLVAAAGMRAQAPLRDAIVGGALPAQHGNGRPASAGEVDAQGRRQGHWDFWHANGRYAAWGSYQDGHRVGQWTFCDVYGRPVEREWPAATPSNRCAEALLLPLTIDDLRATPCGETTLGELLARWLRAAPAERAELERRLGPGTLAAAVVYDDVECQRADALLLLGLLARLPLPDDQPTELLQSLRFDERLGEAAGRVLEHWSAKHACEWQGLLAGDASSRYTGLGNLQAKAYGALPALLREAMVHEEAAWRYAVQQAIGAIVGRHIVRETWLRELQQPAVERRALAIVMLAQQPGQLDAARTIGLLRDADPGIARLARSLLADCSANIAKYDDYLDVLAAVPDRWLQVNVADRWCALGRREHAVPVVRQLLTHDDGKAWLRLREQLATIAVEAGWIDPPPPLPSMASAPDVTEIAAMLRDPQRRAFGWDHVRSMSLREFDPTPFPDVPPDILATWYDLEPVRVHDLVEQLGTAAPDRRPAIAALVACVRFDAKQLAAVVRGLPLAKDQTTLWSVLRPLEPVLRAADPRAAARIRVEPLRTSKGHSGCCVFPSRPVSVGPFDAGLAHLVDDFVRSGDDELVATALGVLEQMGAAGAACLPALSERLSALPLGCLVRVPETVAAVDVQQLPPFCARLIEDLRPEVRRAALQAGCRPLQPFAADDEFARRVLECMVADNQATDWFRHFENGASWLPRLTEALRANPTHHALAQTVACFGDAAREVLQFAHERGNWYATAGLAKLLPQEPKDQRRWVEAYLDPRIPEHALAANWLLGSTRVLSDAVARGMLLAALPRLGSQRESVQRLLLAPQNEGPDTDELALACLPGTICSYRPQRWQRLWRSVRPAEREVALLAASRAVAWLAEPPPGLVDAMIRHLPAARDVSALLNEIARHGATCDRIDEIARHEHRSWNRASPQSWSSQTLAGRIETWLSLPPGGPRESFGRAQLRDPAGMVQAAVGLLATPKWHQGLEALRLLGPQAKQGLSSVADLLVAADDRRRMTALRAFVAMHGGVESALLDLRARFGTRLESVLAEQFATIEAHALLEALRPGAGVERASRELREQRGVAFAWMAAQPEIMPRFTSELRAILRGQDRGMQLAALRALASGGPTMAGLLPDVDALAAVPACHLQALWARRAMLGEPEPCAEPVGGPLR